MARSALNRSRIVLSLIASLLVLSLILAACGGSDDSTDGEVPAIGASGEAFDQEEPESEESAGYSVVSDADQSMPGGEPPAGQIEPDRLVIRTATIMLTVEDTLDATASVRNLAVAKGGFVFSSSTYTEEDRQFAQLTLRVPADRFDETISDLRTAPWVAEVTREESSSQDVSAEYVDNESRLTALEETQRRYLALLEEADTIESILRLESELTSVRSQIEAIKGRQNYLEEMTAFSTITVTLRPADAEEEEPDDEFSIARIFESAWERSTGALAGIAEAIIVLIIFAAFFAPLLALLYLLVRYARRLLARDSAGAVTRPPAD